MAEVLNELNQLCFAAVNRTLAPRHRKKVTSLPPPPPIASEGPYHAIATDKLLKFIRLHLTEAVNEQTKGNPFSTGHSIRSAQPSFHRRGVSKI